jgi:HlyD family secretion protein
MNDKLLRIVSIGSARGGSCRFRRAIVAAVLLLGLWGCGHATDREAGKADQDAATARVTVSVKPAERRSMTESVEGLGRCEALPCKIATLTPALEGRVLKIFVGPMAEVKPGQAIVQLDPTIAQADLQEKLTSRDALDASLRLLQTLPRPQEQEGRKLAIESAKASLAKAEATANNLRRLRARGEIPEQQMYEAELSVTQARLQLQSAQSELTVLMLGPRPAAIDEAKARAASAAAAVNSAQAKVELHTIRAPIVGVVDSITCRLGQTVAAGASIGEIVDSRQVYAAVWLPVDTARRVHQGQPAQVRAGSGNIDRTASNMEANNDPAEWLPGKVDLIGHVADAQTGNLLVRVLVENMRHRLVVGETVAVTIVTGRRENVLAVPATAINDLGEGPLLHVVRQGKAAMLHPRLGLRDGGWVEVLGTDLKPGEPVIVEGGYNLPADTEVKVGAGAAETESSKAP